MKKKKNLENSLKNYKRVKISPQGVQLADRIKWWGRGGDGFFNTDLYIRYCLAKKERE